MRKEILFIILLCSLVNTTCARYPKPFRVAGSAMLPSLSDGDQIFVVAAKNNFNRGEIVTLLFPGDTRQHYVLRIVGVPGDILAIHNGTLIINQEPVNEPYVVQANNQHHIEIEPREISAKRYFVLGDNRDESFDSRYWGTVEESLIDGKYYMTYFHSK